MRLRSVEIATSVWKHPRSQSGDTYCEPLIQEYSPNPTVVEVLARVRCFVKHPEGGGGLRYFGALALKPT